MSGDGTVARLFTIITTNASTIMAELHDQMPVILEQTDCPAWLEMVDGDHPTLLMPAGDDVLACEWGGDVGDGWVTVR
jgi:putative SOS response-associated peptidase YedK